MACNVQFHTELIKIYYLLTVTVHDSDIDNSNALYLGFRGGWGGGL
jgi:hypothetical protein